MIKEKSYWLGKDYDAMFSCPNVSLFRFIGQNVGSIKKKAVIDFGFGGNHAADLIEMNRRGASLCVGVDINPKFVEDFNQQINKSTNQSDMC
jgi:predicted nicotinamide N-methyase